MKGKILFAILTLNICFLLACKKFIEIDGPKDSITKENIFQNDELATSAITGIYSRMGNDQGSTSINCICGLSADEFRSYSASFTEFVENEVTPINASLTSLYYNPYRYIYTANAFLEGVATSNSLSDPLKQQLEGEARFIRAFNYFYLVNLFGEVPLQLTTDYRITRVEPRASVTKVYQQIISDLKAAEGLLTDKYVTKEKVRPNISAVHALLARTYLYMKDWENAEKYSSLVIDKPGAYSLVSLDNVFLKNSSEAIWQLFPPIASGTSNTGEGFLFILQATPQSVSLSNDFVINAFEKNDKRSLSWVKSFVNSTGTYYYPFKYKIRASTTVTEYSTVLRLAEQYLIRAEARAQQNKLLLSIEDLDKIRDRAGLTLIKTINLNISQSDLLNTIQKERRVELFSEWGHRWFDLKRTGQATPVLSIIKPKWKASDILYPLPYDETSRNPNIIQNDGY